MFDIQLKVEKVAEATNYGRFKIEPLEPGYGTTLGNSLRRILLSSLPGAAITSIKIDGVAHEFSSVPHVKEDVTEIILNVKRIRLRSFAERPVRLNLSTSGRRTVLASDIDTPSTIEIVNPEQPLATLDAEDARLEMELTVELGRGYIPADQRESMQIGVIPVDAIYTPIPKVNYVVEHTRVGQITDYDRLIIEIWTDGTIDPGEALSQAAQILTAHSRAISDFNHITPNALPQDNTQALTSPIPTQIYDTPIEELELSVRTYNCLKRSNITKVGQILQMDEKDLLSVRNFGKKSYDELRDKLKSRGMITAQRPGPFHLDGSVDAFGEIDNGSIATEEADSDDDEE